MLTETDEREAIIEGVAKLDIGKAELMCRARIPDQAGPVGGCRRCCRIRR
jgi:hypothetical protein